MTPATISAPVIAEVIAEVIAGYLACALWSYTDEDGINLDTLGAKWGKGAKKMASDNVASFLHVADPADLAAYLDAAHAWGTDGGTPSHSLGFDLWLSAAGHGCGLWDRGLDAAGRRLHAASKGCGAEAYIGDDGKAYLA